MSQFSSKWVKKNNQSLSGKVKEAVRPSDPLKPRLAQAITQINSQVSKLDHASSKLDHRDKEIWSKVVNSTKRKDTASAQVFANELAELRKMNQMIHRTKLALDQITIRLNTVQELGDVVVTLTPAMSVIKNIQSGMTNIIPQAENEMNRLSNLLSEIMPEAGETGKSELNIDIANEESQKIMDEASAIAEEQMHSKFPDLPEPLSNKTRIREAT